MEFQSSETYVSKTADNSYIVNCKFHSNAKYHKNKLTFRSDLHFKLLSDLHVVTFKLRDIGDLVKRNSLQRRGIFCRGIWF